KSPDALSLGQSCVEASRDEVSCGKIVRRSLMAIGLLAGWLTVVLMAGGCSKQAVKDPRLQSPRVEVFKAKAAGSNGRPFTGTVSKIGRSSRAPKHSWKRRRLRQESLATPASMPSY